QTSGDRVSSCNLAAIVLQNIAHRALQHSRPPTSTRVKASSVLAQLVACATSFDADHLDRSVVEKRMKQSDRIRSATNTRDQNIRQATFLYQDLSACFAPDHALKVAHHQRIRMWTKRTAEQVISVAHIRDPITQRFVDCIFERARAGVYFANFG